MPAKLNISDEERAIRRREQLRRYDAKRRELVRKYAPPKPPTKIDFAQGWLLGYWEATGKVSWSEISNAARAYGISNKTFQRALVRLGWTTQVQCFIAPDTSK